MRADRRETDRAVWNDHGRREGYEAPPTSLDDGGSTLRGGHTSGADTRRKSPRYSPGAAVEVRRALTPVYLGRRSQPRPHDQSLRHLSPMEGGGAARSCPLLVVSLVETNLMLTAVA